MRLFKSSVPAVSIALLLGALTLPEALLPIAAGLVEPAAAQPGQEMLLARSARRRLSFRVGVRPSRYRVGGFSRSAACGSDQTLMALVPPTQQQERLPNGQATVDKTASAHPTFFVHLPALPGKTALFTLQNEAGTGNDLYRVKFALTSKPGVVGIALPASAPALQVGQKYLWQVAIACDPDDSASSIVVSSWVERVNSPAAGDDRVATLAEQGIWQDAVTLLALRRYQQPQDQSAAEDWATLMEDAGLPQFKQSEIVQIVQK